MHALSPFYYCQVTIELERTVINFSAEIFLEDNTKTLLRIMGHFQSFS